ncbi:MAG: carboxypeptidase regulatory-like domain-containing protein [Vicinamibacterales bacterium]
MKSRFRAVLAILAIAFGAASAHAQQQTGEIFGRVTDSSGAVLPGVTVTVTGPSLLQPLTAVASESGTFQFPRLEVGTYRVRFELAGFKTVIKEDMRITVGFSANASTQLGVSAVQETVTVTGATPVVDTKETGTRQTFTLEQLQSIPSARDPWVILQQTAGIAMDRENIGGNMSGQQSNYVSRGGNPTNNKWAIDGVDMTDLAATGSSSVYYDFDAFQEMTINTGGVDVTQQTGGVGINLVTKSGTDRFKGSSRLYDTNDRFEANNIIDAQRARGATTGNPIQDIQDYGIEMGGPVKKGRAWIWGSYGKQNVKVGVINFYRPDANCQAIKAAPLTFSIKDNNDCLNTDLTLLESTNLKGEVQLFKGNKFSAYNLLNKKERNARNASDTTPIESTQRQGAITSQFGRKGWVSGPNPTYKFGDQWVLSDRTLLDVQYSHVGGNFILDFHEPGNVDIQPTLVVAGAINGRSGARSVNIRPANSVTANMNYFMPNKAGGDHAFKIGGYWRDNYAETMSMTGGRATARFPTSVSNDCAALAAANPTDVTRWCAANLNRDGDTIQKLTNLSAYVQDTLSHGRATFQLGLRYDYNHEKALGASIAANPILPQWLPAITFEGADPKVRFHDLSPRLGMTYDLLGNGKTIAHANYARYFGQVGTGGISGQINPVTAASVRFPWTDANGDKFIQANEIVTGLANVLNFTGNYDPANPGAVTTSNTIDPDFKNDTTDEIIIGLDREVGRGFAVGANYIWRSYYNFTFLDTVGFEPSDFTARTLAPTCTNATARCEAVTYYAANFPAPGTVNETNFTKDQYNRAFNGFELTGRKRMADRWMLNTSFAFNSTKVNNGFGGAFANTFVEDPTNRDRRDNFQYDYATAGSGLGNIYVNAKWLFKVSGLYNLPGNVNVSAFYNARQGYPYEPIILVSRGNGVGNASVLLDNVGENRLPNYQNLDLHVERPVVFGRAHFVPSLDLFNVTNNNTVQALQRQQNAATANNISAVVAPRVLRFGVRVSW